MSIIEQRRKALRLKIIDHFLNLAERRPYDRISRDDIVADLNMVPANLNHIFGPVSKLRDEMMVRAVETERLRVIASGLERGHPVAKAAPEELKKRALETLI